MSGRTTVETEYIGKRRFFKNSYFASFAQMATRLGRRSGRVPIAVAVVAMNDSVFLCETPSAWFGLRSCAVLARERQEGLIQPRAADFDSRNLKVELQQLPQHVFGSRCLDHHCLAVRLYICYTRHLADHLEWQFRDAANLLSCGSRLDFSRRPFSNN